MPNRYFFDKRDMKRGFFKYLIIFLISFVPLILFNIFVGKYIAERWLRILINCMILLVFVAIGNAIAMRVFEKKDRQLEARIKAREEMEARKRKILEDSYKQKRESKLKKKLEQENSEIVVEKDENKNTKKKGKQTKSVTRRK